MMERMLAQLTQCEYAFVKSRRMATMSNKELKNYENLSHDISSDIEQARENIDYAKHAFKVAKIVRKNRAEYELLANSINEQPDRKQTNEQLLELQKELKLLEVSITLSESSLFTLCTISR